MLKNSGFCAYKAEGLMLAGCKSLRECHPMKLDFPRNIWTSLHSQFLNFFRGVRDDDSFLLLTFLPPSEEYLYYKEYNFLQEDKTY